MNGDWTPIVQKTHPRWRKRVAFSLNCIWPHSFWLLLFEQMECGECFDTGLMEQTWNSTWKRRFFLKSLTCEQSKHENRTQKVVIGMFVCVSASNDMKGRCLRKTGDPSCPSSARTFSLFPFDIWILDDRWRLIPPSAWKWMKSVPWRCNGGFHGERKVRFSSWKQTEEGGL